MQYGTTRDGKSVERFEIGRRDGPLLVDLITYGATITGIHTPDRNGKVENVVLSYADLGEYEHQPPPRAYYGATIGRYANRIAHGRLTLNGHTYDLSRNENGHTLHGGARGFDAVVWAIGEAGPDAVRLLHRSPDGDQGFPGTLGVAVTFAVDGDTLSVLYEARCDRDT